MKSNRRTQADRSAATQDALVQAARTLFAEHGFAAVATETIVRAAGVTRGALYHQFADKTGLFAAVFEQVEAEVTQQIATLVGGAGESDPIEVMRLGAGAWLDACARPEVQRIVLVDAPAVLGWERWREIAMRHGLGLVQGLLTLGIEVGRVPAQPVTPLAHVLIGALDEAALYVTRSDEPIRARAEIDAVLARLIGTLTAQ